jgi:uncharacterized protein YcbX
MPVENGILQSITRFPIKSFQGESITSTTLQPQGIYTDRPLAESGSFADLKPLHLLTTASLAPGESLRGQQHRRRPISTRYGGSW